MSTTTQRDARARADSPKPMPKKDDDAKLETPKQASVFSQLLWSAWDKYDQDELAHHARVTHIDRVGLCVLTVGYALLALCAPRIHDSSPPPLAIRCLQLFFTIFAVVNLHLQNHALVKPTKTCPAEYFVTDGPLGRFIWMTHQTINLVCVHFVLSMLAPSISARLVAGTHAAAVPVGGLAVFCTVQFFLLVYPLEDTAKEYKIWADRGIHMKLIDVLRHLWPGFLACVDVLVLKSRSLLSMSMPSLVMLVLINVIYAIAYLIWTRVNYKITGQWQYGLLKDLGQDTAAWVKFGAIQGAVLSTFALVLALFVRWFPAFW